MKYAFIEEVRRGLHDSLNELARAGGYEPVIIQPVFNDDVPRFLVHLAEAEERLAEESGRIIIRGAA